ncbi:MAG TPA: FtsX-like permease family protein, partial [Saprospiraceae bacterium]|nr:FtsX-like permease family protein [Saprospiraceae bacterium]
ADKLQIKVGKEVIVSFVKNKNKVRRKLKVVGIFNTGLEEYDKRFVLGNMNQLRALLEWNENQVAGIEVFLDDIRDSEIITDYIYNSILPSNIYAETIQQKFPSIFEWLKLQDINEKVILQLMGIVAVINMMTVLLILILERTHMVGILKSLGSTNWQVQKIFLYQASVIILFGQLLGNVIGLGLAFLQKTYKFIKLDEENYYLDTAPIYLDWQTVLWINFGAFIFILLFLVLPTFIINRIKPISALRFN